ncbi:hypothetical protein [uncultured Mitsuokella sp.]|uniref:hypothetical protein n=1 Tax=uncultured Mitsuokella sp. TaxID=453120 RepID=UPI0026DCEB5C|nr:hypothetical protein [uncultured Mitsuokella sp.]
MQFSTHTYEFTGYQTYEKTQKKIEALLRDAFEADNFRFFMAVNEAVCNAARYSIHKPQKARITIEVRIMNYDVAVKVSSATTPFRAEEYQKKLRHILEDEKASNMEWGDYLGFTLASRGFYYMLSAVDYLYVDQNGQSVTLCAKIPYDPSQPYPTRLRDIIPKFLVSKNGVIV